MEPYLFWPTLRAFPLLAAILETLPSLDFFLRARQKINSFIRLSLETLLCLSLETLMHLSLETLMHLSLETLVCFSFIAPSNLLPHTQRLDVKNYITIYL
jgi:hypothetical protein